MTPQPKQRQEICLITNDILRLFKYIGLTMKISIINKTITYKIGRGLKKIITATPKPISSIQLGFRKRYKMPCEPKSLR